MRRVTVKSFRAAMRMGEKLLANGIEWFRAVLDEETGMYIVTWKPNEALA